MNNDPGHSEWPDDPDGSGPWSDLTDDLLGLTDRLRGTYRQVADETGPSEAEVRDAFATLAGAWNQVAGAVGVAIQDQEVRDHLKKAASSLANAVAASLAEFLPGDQGSAGSRQTEPHQSEDTS